MPEITRLVVGQLKTNCYLISEKGAAIIIDAGDDADYIERVLSDKALKPVSIIATHGHFDHVMATTELKLAYKIPFYINPLDSFLLKRAQASAKHFLGVGMVPPAQVDLPLKEGSTLKQGGVSFQVIGTAGHTPGSVSLYDKQSEIVFVGDLIFADGRLGRHDMSYGDRNKLLTSIKKILKLPSKTVVYSGHGEPTTVFELKKFFDN